MLFDLFYQHVSFRGPSSAESPRGLVNLMVDCINLCFLNLSTLVLPQSVNSVGHSSVCNSSVEVQCNSQSISSDCHSLPYLNKMYLWHQRQPFSLSTSHNINHWRLIDWSFSIHASATLFTEDQGNRSGFTSRFSLESRFYYLQFLIFVSFYQSVSIQLLKSFIMAESSRTTQETITDVYDLPESAIQLHHYIT